MAAQTLGVVTLTNTPRYSEKNPNLILGGDVKNIHFVDRLATTFRLILLRLSQ